MVFIYANNLHRIKMHSVSPCMLRNQLIVERKKAKDWRGQMNIYSTRRMVGVRWEGKGPQMQKGAERAEMSLGKTFDLQ